MYDTKLRWAGHVERAERGSAEHDSSQTEEEEGHANHGKTTPRKKCFKLRWKCFKLAKSGPGKRGVEAKDYVGR